MSTSRPRTLFEKVWDAHVVERGAAGAPDVLYVDLHLVHEVTSPQAFAVLDERGLAVRRPDRTLATMDHSTPTWISGTSMPVIESAAAAQLSTLEGNCARHGIPLHALGDAQRGIVHVIGPELGRTQPGMTIVCGDSHTSTHGAFGALAFGIGTSEVGHVLATQCLLQQRPKTMAVTVQGALPPFLIGGYGSALANVFTGRFPTVQVGMQFELNLRNRTAEAALAQTAIAEKRLALEKTRIEQAIDAQVRNALQGLVASRQRIAAAEESAKAAQEKLNSEVRLFQTGESTNFFVLQRQNELLESRRRAVVAHLEYNKSAARLEQARGETLETMSIKLK